MRKGQVRRTANQGVVSEQTKDVHTRTHRENKTLVHEDVNSWPVIVPGRPARSRPGPSVDLATGVATIYVKLQQLFPNNRFLVKEYFG